jgi:hypothetical protein
MVVLRVLWCWRPHRFGHLVFLPDQVYAYVYRLSSRQAWWPSVTFHSSLISSAASDPGKYLFASLHHRLHAVCTPGYFDAFAVRASFLIRQRMYWLMLCGTTLVIQYVFRPSVMSPSLQFSFFPSAVFEGNGTTVRLP